MLRLEAAGAETLWDELLPAEVRALPAELAALDALLGDPALLAPITGHRAREALVAGRSAIDHGRPTIVMPLRSETAQAVSSRIRRGGIRALCGAQR